MTGGEERDRQTGLSGWAKDARVRSAAYAAHAVTAAKSEAAINGQVNRMIERVVAGNPAYARQLRAIIVTAASQRTAIAERRRSSVASRPDGRLLSRPRDEPGAAVATEPDGQLAEMPVIAGRDRPAGGLQDRVIREIFTAGLTLQDAADLTTEPEVRWRIEAAADELDELIRITREEFFSTADRPPGPESGSGLDDVTSPAGYQ